jgi:hypothetical protein
MRLAKAQGITQLRLNCTDYADKRKRDTDNHQAWIVFARGSPVEARNLKDALVSNAIMENVVSPPTTATGAAAANGGSDPEDVD